MNTGDGAEVAAQKKERNGSDEDGEFGMERGRSDGREYEEGRLSVVVGERYEAEATNAGSGSRFYES